MTTGTFGVDPRQPDILNYQGTPVFVTPCVNVARAPTVFDINYTLLTLWRYSNQTPDVDGNMLGDLWYLANFFLSGTKQEANWVKFGTAASNIQSFTGGANTNGTFPVGPDGSGHIQLSTNNPNLTITGSTIGHTLQFNLSGGGAGTLVSLIPDIGTTITDANPTLSADTTIQAAGTFANFAQTNGISNAEMDWQFQYAGSNPATADSTMYGISQFDSNMFDVTNGYVQIIGGGTTGAVTNIVGDDSLTVIPSSGTITLTGHAVAGNNAVHAKPVFFKRDSASDEGLDIQVASGQAAANLNKAGLASFLSTQFTVDPATGFVQLVGGVTPPILQFILDDGLTVSPNGSGQVTVKGSTIANGTSTPVKAVTTVKNGASEWDIQVQYAAANATDVGTKVGLASFDSTQFSVSATGFVHFTGGASFTWIDQAVNLTAAVSTGYFCTAALTMNLPTASQGDVINVVVDTTGTVVVQAGMGVSIRMGNQISSSGGTFSSTARGDTLELVYRAATSTWFCKAGSNGIWSIA